MQSDRLTGKADTVTSTQNSGVQSETAASKQAQGEATQIHLALGMVSSLISDAFCLTSLIFLTCFQLAVTEPVKVEMSADIRVWAYTASHGAETQGCSSSKDGSFGKETLPGSQVG